MLNFFLNICLGLGRCGIYEIIEPVRQIERSRRPSLVYTPHRIGSECVIVEVGLGKVSLQAGAIVGAQIYVGISHRIHAVGRAIHARTSQLAIQIHIQGAGVRYHRNQHPALILNAVYDIATVIGSIFAIAVIIINYISMELSTKVIKNNDYLFQ